MGDVPHVLRSTAGAGEGDFRLLTTRRPKLRASAPCWTVGCCPTAPDCYPAVQKIPTSGVTQLLWVTLPTCQCVAFLHDQYSTTRDMSKLSLTSFCNLKALPKNAVKKKWRFKNERNTRNYFCSFKLLEQSHFREKFCLYQVHKKENKGQWIIQSLYWMSTELEKTPSRSVTHTRAQAAWDLPSFPKSSTPRAA